MCSIALLVLLIPSRSSVNDKFLLQCHRGCCLVCCVVIPPKLAEMAVLSCLLVAPNVHQKKRVYSLSTNRNSTIKRKGKLFVPAHSGSNFEIDQT